MAAGVCKYLHTSYVLHTVSETQKSSPERWVARQSAAHLSTALKRPWANPSTTHDHFALRIKTAKRRHPCRRVAINLSAKLEHIKAYSSQHYYFSERCSRTHNALSCCSHHSFAKNITFSLWILRAKAVKCFSFPFHGSCTDVTDQSLTFLELSIFFG